MNLQLDEWLSVIRTDCLERFIREGGTAVKFAVAMDDDVRPRLRDQLARLSADLKFLCVTLDGASTRLHLVDKLFNAIAKQVPWEKLARDYVVTLFREHGYDSASDNNTNLVLKNLAARHGRVDILLGKDFASWLEASLFRDYAMSQEFRIAMIQLCRAQVQLEGPGGGIVQYIVQWLCGELESITVLKPALIFQRVARHNARHLLFSLVRWLRVVGFSGLVLHLDISAYLEQKALSRGSQSFHYSDPATLDLYESLRQFIDAADEVEGMLLIVSAPRGFQDPAHPRGLRRYHALLYRVLDEVHDKQRANPFAPLARLTLDSQDAPSVTKLLSRLP